jgi:hypothetical protein
MKYFKVQTGYGQDDFISVDETELEMCVRAQVTGKTALTKQGSVSGNEIKKIIPDWNRTMGYNRLYKLNSEDYAEIGNKTMDEHYELIENTNLSVSRQVQGLPPLPPVQKPIEITSGMYRLAEKMRIK